MVMSPFELMSSWYRSCWLFLAFTGVAALILGGADGCTDKSASGGEPRSAVAKGPPAEPFTAAAASEAPEGVDIVIDATLSMKGFTTSSQYKSLVAQSLSNAAPGGANVRYRKLSTALPGGIRDLGDKMRTTNGSFYENGGDTRLQTAIDSAQADRLTVLITDLFQTSADMNAVSQSLTKYVLQNEKSVGLFGVRFPFEGRVFDLGFEGRSFSFNGDRPVYGLVLGTPAQVSQYFASLRTFIPSSDYQYLLFGAQIAEKSAGIESVDSRSNLVQVAPKGAPRLPQDRTVSVRVRNNNKEAQLLAMLRTHVFKEATSLVRVGKVETVVSDVWRFDGGREEYSNTFSNSSSAKEALTAEVLSRQNRQHLQLSLRPQGLKRGSYCFNLVVKVKEWTLPDWVSEWSLPPSQFQSDNPDGTKTANLRPFLLDLASNITHSATPKLGSLQVFVQKTS